MIKIVQSNDEGKIVLTKEELEQLLEQSYDEGYSDGKLVSISRVNDSYEKIPYWMRPDYKPTINCSSNVGTSTNKKYSIPKMGVE